MTEKLDSATAARAGRTVSAPWEVADVERNLNVTRTRLARRQQRRRLQAALGLILAAAAMVFLVLARANATGSSPTVVTALAQPGEPEPVTRFADGSSGRLVSPGKLVVRTATATRIETRLESGSAEFEVTANPGRAFVVEAGPISVQVIGTHFLVERSGPRTRVSVTRGKVRVLGVAPALLEAGESRWFSAETPAPELSATERAEDQDSASDTGGTNDSGTAGTLQPAVTANGSRSAPTPARERFLELAHQGDYAGAYKVLRQSPSAVAANAEELMLAADSARLSKHPQQALTYLRRVTRDFPQDARAALSAFTQGRILLSQLGRPAEAATAFELARRLSPTGALAEDSLARQAEASFRSGATQAARQLLTEYEKRYPNGKHRSTLSKLAAESR